MVVAVLVENVSMVVVVSCLVQTVKNFLPSSAFSISFDPAFVFAEECNSRFLEIQEMSVIIAICENFNFQSTFIISD